MPKIPVTKWQNWAPLRIGGITNRPVFTITHTLCVFIALHTFEELFLLFYIFLSFEQVISPFRDFFLKRN